MKMFGGFGPKFFNEYHGHVPRAEPVKEYDDRVELYQLYDTFLTTLPGILCSNCVALDITN